MIILNENKPHIITLSTKVKNKAIERFPNQLIWDINSFLLGSFQLYEFYLSSQKETKVAIKISKSGCRKNEFLCFEHLNQMYRKAPDYSEKECQAEYEKYRSEVADYNVFREMYLMETISELDYFAIDNFDDFFEIINGEDIRNLNNSKKIKSMLRHLCPVCVFIGDHDWMEIHIRELDIQKSLISIISKYVVI